jgi:hypothetical protein
MMKCNEYDKYFHDYADGVLSLPKKRDYKGHIDGCVWCAEMLQRNERYLKYLSAISSSAKMPSGADLRFRGRLQFTQYKDLRHEEFDELKGIDSDSGVIRWRRDKGAVKTEAAQTVVLMGKRYFVDELSFQEEGK